MRGPRARDDVVQVQRERSKKKCSKTSTENNSTYGGVEEWEGPHLALNPRRGAVAEEVASEEKRRELNAAAREDDRGGDAAADVAPALLRAALRLLLVQLSSSEYEWKI